MSFRCYSVLIMQSWMVQCVVSQYRSGCVRIRFSSMNQILNPTKINKEMDNFSQTFPVSNVKNKWVLLPIPEALLKSLAIQTLRYDRICPFWIYVFWMLCSILCCSTTSSSELQNILINWSSILTKYIKWCTFINENVLSSNTLVR